MNKTNFLVFVVYFTGVFSFAGNKAEFRLINSVFSVNATDDFLPLWLHSNENGIFDAYSSGDHLWIPEVKGTVDFGKGFSLETGLEALLNTQFDNSRLQQAYVKLNKGPFSFLAGRKNFIIDPVQSAIGTGSYLFSGNARPYWRTGGGILNYVSIPGTADFIQVKGASYFGIINEDRKPYGINNPYIHDKYGYIKFGRTKFSFFAGLMHSVIFGGEDQNGNNLPVDLWPTITGANSEKFAELAPGEDHNAPGTHNAVWDFGVHIADRITLSFQKPFKDNSGKQFWQGMNNDFIAGIHVKTKKIWLSHVFLEYFQSIHQSGPGVTDYAVNGRIVALNSVSAPDNFMQQYFDTLTNGWTKKDLIAYVKKTENNGYEYGGRDEYFNNWLYRQGYSYDKRSLGTPLFYTFDQMLKMTGDFIRNGNFYFVNNRIVSWHIGISGSNKNSFLEYKLKLTRTRNYGNYTDKYKSYRFEKIEGYYFSHKPDQYYSLLEIGYNIPARQYLKLKTALAADFGNIYTNYGLKIGLTYIW